MAGLHSLKLSSVFLVLCVLGRMIGCRASDQERKMYIVYMGNLGDSEKSFSTYHKNMLQEVVDNRYHEQNSDLVSRSILSQKLYKEFHWICFLSSTIHVLKWYNSGHSQPMVSKLRSIHCPDKKTASNDLNYPAMTFRVTASSNNKSTPFSTEFSRTVTNVGSPNSSYTVTTSTSLDYNITVNPSILKFKALNEKQSFEVIIYGKISNRTMLSASLEWSDGIHRVKSPIVVYTDNL